MALLNRGKGARGESVALADLRRHPSLGALEIEHDPRFARREWRLQRAGWVFLAVLVAAAMTGALGGEGPLSQARVQAGDQLTVEYDRVARHAGRARLSFTVQPSAFRNGRARLWIDREYLQGFRISSTGLDPETAEVSEDRVVYEFVPADPTRPLEVQFDIEPDARGIRDSRVGIDGGPETTFRQLVLP